jgi:transposase
VNREHDLPEEEKFCPETGKPLVKWIGQEEAEQLAYQPASAYVIRHIQHKYARLEENLNGTKPEVVTADRQ